MKERKKKRVEREKRRRKGKSFLSLFILGNVRHTNPRPPTRYTSRSSSSDEEQGAGENWVGATFLSRSLLFRTNAVRIYLASFLFAPSYFWSNREIKLGKYKYGERRYSRRKYSSMERSTERCVVRDAVWASYQLLFGSLNAKVFLYSISSYSVGSPGLE